MLIIVTGKMASVYTLICDRESNSVLILSILTQQLLDNCPLAIIAAVSVFFLSSILILIDPEIALHCYLAIC